MQTRLLVVSSLVLAVLSTAALAQGDPGFCGRYAQNMAGVGDAAVKRNPACLDYSKGVHSNFQSHFQWCMRTPAASVQGAEANIRRLVTQCTGNAGQRPAGGPQSKHGCTVFEHRDYQGRHFGVVPNGSTNRSSLSNGISSMKVQPGCQIVVYSEPNLKGPSRAFASNVPWVGQDWNDVISSYRCNCR